MCPDLIITAADDRAIEGVRLAKSLSVNMIHFSCIIDELSLTFCIMPVCCVKNTSLMPMHKSYNAVWPDITAELLSHQTAQDRPELVSQVFNLKLKELLYDLKERKLFSRTVAFIHVIEFQKQGLPHAHILIILHSTDKPRTPADIDSMVCAEIPCQATHPELYETIVSFMLHGPCGTVKPDADRKS